jgi:hypothetical protein
MAKNRRGPVRQKPPVQPRRSDKYGTGDVSEEQQRWIGLVVLNWAKLEQNIEDTIWSFLDLDLDDGKLITARLNTDSKIEMFKALSRTYLRGELLDDTIDSASLINGYKEDRNFIVHGSWGTLQPENVPVCASLRPKAPPEEVIVETFPEARMRAIVDGILEAIGNVRSLRELLETSREKPQQKSSPDSTDPAQDQ